MFQRNQIDKEREEKFQEITKQRAKEASKMMHQQKNSKEKIGDAKQARYKSAMNCKKEKIIETPAVKQKIAVVDDVEVKPSIVENKFKNVTKNLTQQKDATYSTGLQNQAEQNVHEDDSQSDSCELSDEDDNVIFRQNKNLLQANERYCGIRMMVRNK